jgi:hypothetical protein
MLDHTGTTLVHPASNCGRLSSVSQFLGHLWCRKCHYTDQKAAHRQRAHSKRLKLTGSPGHDFKCTEPSKTRLPLYVSITLGTQAWIFPNIHHFIPHLYGMKKALLAETFNTILVYIDGAWPMVQHFPKLKKTICSFTVEWKSISSGNLCSVDRNYLYISVQYITCVLSTRCSHTQFCDDKLHNLTFMMPKIQKQSYSTIIQQINYTSCSYQATLISFEYNHFIENYFHVNTHHDSKQI